jgi:hypothetical protein
MLWSRPLATGAVALVGLLALFRFARREGRLLSGLAGLLAVTLLCESHAALAEGPMRIFFQGGATLFGWLCGLAWARGIGREEEGESLAESGSVAALAATYVAAAGSKLLASGLSWADADALRAVVLSQHRIDGAFGGYANAIGSHAGLARALAAGTLISQAAMILYPWSPRARALTGTLALAFHLNVWLLTPILFPQAMALLLVFSYPWRDTPKPSESAPARLAPAALRLGAVFLVLGGLFMTPWVRAYTALHHHHAGGGPPPPAPSHTPAAEQVRARYRLHEGDVLAAGFRLAAVGDPHDGELVFWVERNGDYLRIDAVPRGRRPFAAPLSRGDWDLYYQKRPASVGQDDLQAVLGAIAGRLL